MKIFEILKFTLQHRNQHDLMADFNAEIPLYEQSEALVQILEDFKCIMSDLPNCLFELYVELRERQFFWSDQEILVNVSPKYW